MSVRNCRFAGVFFSEDRKKLATEVGAYLDAAAEASLAGAAPPRAIVAAHAGYPYSGHFAGLSFGAVTWTPERVVVLAPSHRHWFSGLAFPSQEAFSTPLGALAIDRAACDVLAAAGNAHEEDAAHDNEHAIETQLPFIRTLWPDAKIVPLVCGDVSAEQVAAAIDMLEGPETLTVLSSDLSHFLTQSDAQDNDAETARLLETGAGSELTPQHACGAKCLQGWLLSRAGQGTKALRLGMGDSAAVTGDSSRVVGYGAWAFYPIDTAMLNSKSQTELLGLARSAISERLAAGCGAAISPDRALTPLQTHAASFVTLTSGETLRGCVGSNVAQRSLASDVTANAVGAGLRDQRFQPVTIKELPNIRIEVSVLSKAQEIHFASEKEMLSRIVPSKDGLILSAGGRRGTFLPKVWKALPEPHAFLQRLKLKAGLSENHRVEDITLHRFRVESFREAPSNC